MKKNTNAAVFILLGQSNAVGHGIPMEAADQIDVPMKNVFGLHRRENQSFDTKLTPDKCYFDTCFIWKNYDFFELIKSLSFVALDFALEAVICV